MSFAYSIKDQGSVYFIPCTVHQWVDVLTHNQYYDLLIGGLKYCQQEKRLEIYAWVIMSNHCYLIVRAKNKNLSDVIRDFKKIAAKYLYHAIGSNPQ